MKKILALASALAFSISISSQSLSYNDLGVLLSHDDNYGTARFNAMSGAFGALGGDVSSIGINPAGGVIALKNQTSITLGNRATDLTSNYYGTSLNYQDSFFHIPQIGAVLVFDTNNSSGWSRFALSTNYRLKKDYNSFFEAEGNSNLLSYTEHPNDIKTVPSIFDRSLSQSFYSNRSGESSVLNIGLSAVHNNKLYVGGALNFHEFEFGNITSFTERNDDVDGNILRAQEYVETYIQGNGFSLSLGLIYKFDQNVRFGLAYETPTWYQEVIQDYYDEISIEHIPDLNIDSYYDLIGPETYLFSFRSPSRITASAAYVFGKNGLISADYTFKDYTNIKFYNNDFRTTNRNFGINYRDTHTVNIGTEWRFDNLSIRGGYRYEKDPNLLAGGNTNKDNIRSFSTGLGYNFGNTKIDLGYTQSENKTFYSIYRTGDVNVDQSTTRITGTITFSL